MSTEIGVLSGEDISILRRLIEREKTQRKNTPLREEFEPDYGAPDIYIAYPQDEIRAWTDTAGTGDDIAGTGQADIYKLVKESGDFHIKKITNLSKLVYNPGDAISDGPIIIARDKFGYWIPLVGPAGGAVALANFSRFPVSGDHDPYYDPSYPCKWAYAVVSRSTCGGVPEFGSTIRVWDDMGCWFNGVLEIALSGVSLVITKTKGDPSEVGTGLSYGTGTYAANEDDCHWTVISRCCTGDV